MGSLTFAQGEKSPGWPDLGMEGAGSSGATGSWQWGVEKSGLQRRFGGQVCAQRSS